MSAIPGYAHLAKDETHRGGAVRVVEINVRVSGIVQMYRSGMTPAEIAEYYDPAPPGAIHSALAYAADHPAEIEAEIAAEEAVYQEYQKNPQLPAKLRSAIEQAKILP